MFYSSQAEVTVMLLSGFHWHRQQKSLNGLQVDLRKKMQSLDQQLWTHLKTLSLPRSTPIPSHPIPSSSSSPHRSLFHTLIVVTYRKINFHYPVERANVSPLCLIDDTQTPSHTLLLFIAPQSWSPFSAFLWQIITGDVIAIPSGE